MARTKKRGFMDRMLLGKEKSEDYARSTLPSNRWELFWDIFKGSFWKIVRVNVVTLLFLLPVFAILLFRYFGSISFGSLMPFSQGIGVGYFAPTSLVGYNENVSLTVNMSILVFLPIAAIIGSIGIAGCAYVIRNMVWTEGIFVSNDFWRGIKQNFRSVVIISLLYSIMLTILIIANSFIEQLLVSSFEPKWALYVALVVSYLLIVLFTSMYMHMISMTVTYDLSLFSLFKNSLIFTIGLFPLNVFFFVLAAIPFLLMYIGGFITLIAIFLIMLFGIGFSFLVWTNYCQWAYDKFINDKIGAKKNRGIYEKVNKGSAESLKKYKAQMETFERSSLSSRPIKPITDDELQLAELPQSFNRSDIEKLNESRKAIYDDNERYIEEHKAEFAPVEEEKPDKDSSEKEKRILKAQKALNKRKRK